MKLNLASGTDIRDGWINLDIVPRWPNTRRGCDLIWDARKDPIPFAPNSAEEIYAGYLLLHLAPKFHAPVLKEIHRVLSPQGTVMFGEVDFEVVMRQWLLDPLNPRLAELIWGEQGNDSGDEFADFDKHCHGFTEESLRRTLLDAGFSDITRTKIHAVDYELTLVCRKV
jgi:ubiquinone/menaquinone biosynthesis C-methylase UbiE